MTQKNYAATTGTIFAVIAVVHAFRLLNGWHVQVGNFAVPLWISAVAVIVAGYLAYQGLSRKR